MAPDSAKTTWFITRSSGLTAFLLLWLSTAWGLLIPSRLLENIIPPMYVLEFHQTISLLAIFFLCIHIGILLLDHYAPFTLLQILFPFVSNYRPLWVGIGVISFYLILLVTITFYVRDRIGKKAFRWIHLLSFLGFLGGTVHGLFSGTDSSLPFVQGLYGWAILSTVFLTAYWLVDKQLSHDKYRHQLSNPRLKRN